MNATYKCKSVVILELLSSLQDKSREAQDWLTNCQLSKTDFNCNYHTCSIIKSYVISDFLRLHLIAQVKYTHTASTCMHVYARLRHHLVITWSVTASLVSSAHVGYVRSLTMLPRLEARKRTDVYYSLS